MDLVSGWSEALLCVVALLVLVAVVRAFTAADEQDDAGKTDEQREREFWDRQW